MISRISLTGALKSLPPGASISKWVLWLGLALGLGGYTSLTFALVQDVRYQMLLLSAPILLAGLLSLYKHAIPALVALMTVSLIASARLRLGPNVFRPGGAELALAPLDLALLALVLLWVVQILRTGKVPRIYWTVIDYALIPFLMMHFASIFFSQIKPYSVLEFVRLLKMILLVWILRVTVHESKHLRMIVTVLLLSITFVGGLALAEWMFHRTFGLGFLGERDQFWIAPISPGVAIGRVGATLGHPNVLAAFLIGTLPLALAMFLARTDRLMTILSAGAIISGLIGLILTFSRSGWVSTSIIFIAIILIAPRVLGLTRRWLYVVGVLTIIGSGLFLVFNHFIILRLTASPHMSMALRVQLNIVAIKMLKSHPIIGVGLNTFAELMSQYDTVGISRFVTLPAYNILLLYGAEAGIIGLISFLLLIGSVVWLTARVISYCKYVHRRSNSNALFYMGSLVGFAGGLVAILLQGMLDWVFRYDPIFTLVWFQIGVILIIHRQTKALG